eukprot:CAMPEP_0205878820 /NCGR_PEP_ID=MMETSP1083-20121108/15066_1 /ASSEMBLY_ACC=CAM_ASM_000430 /TAXON_ID=97485 /ORGANISM="Prymnesium parvum, Strain Texoma1" /LENGTH=448 /DNA_ID=CAMNT_0053241735 /DNA_START=54 /DNA_END=1397 /DNA_ORIENTATION=-
MHFPKYAGRTSEVQRESSRPASALVRKRAPRSAAEHLDGIEERAPLARVFREHQEERDRVDEHRHAALVGVGVEELVRLDPAWVLRRDASRDVQPAIRQPLEGSHADLRAVALIEDVDGLLANQLALASALGDDRTAVEVLCLHVLGVVLRVHQRAVRPVQTKEVVDVGDAGAGDDALDGDTLWAQASQVEIGHRLGELLDVDRAVVVRVPLAEDAHDLLGRAELGELLTHEVEQLGGDLGARGELGVAALAREASVFAVRAREEALAQPCARADARDGRAWLGRGVVDLDDLVRLQREQPVALRDEVVDQLDAGDRERLRQVLAVDDPPLLHIREGDGVVFDAAGAREAADRRRAAARRRRLLEEQLAHLRERLVLRVLIFLLEDDFPLRHCPLHRLVPRLDAEEDEARVRPAAVAGHHQVLLPSASAVGEEETETPAAAAAAAAAA